MKINILLLQDIGRWTDGWIAYSLYGIVVIAIFVFIIYKVRKGKERKRKNERIRKEDIEKGNRKPARTTMFKRAFRAMNF